MTERDHRADYYDNDYEDGSGVWVKSDDYEREARRLLERRRQLFEVIDLVRAGQACYWPRGKYLNPPWVIIEDAS